MLGDRNWFYPPSQSSSARGWHRILTRNDSVCRVLSSVWRAWEWHVTRPTFPAVTEALHRQNKFPRIRPSDGLAFLRSKKLLHSDAPGPLEHDARKDRHLHSRRSVAV